MTPVRVCPHTLRAVVILCLVLPNQLPAADRQQILQPHSWLHWAGALSLAGSVLICCWLLLDRSRRARTEQALRRAETGFQTLFDSSGDSIFIHDLAGNILAANQLACDRLGYPLQELTTMTIDQIDAPDQRQYLAQRLASLSTTGKAVFDSVHLQRDGRQVPVEVRSKSINYQDQQAVISVVRDSTERKRAEEELHLQAQLLEQEIAEHQRAEDLLRAERNNFRAIFASAPVGMVLLETDGTILAVNNVIAAMFGREPDHFLAQKLGDFLICTADPRCEGGCWGNGERPPCSIDLAIHKAVERNQQTHAIEIQHQFSLIGTDRQIWLQFSVEPLQLLGRKHVIVSLDDISERKQAEQALFAEKERLAVTLRSIGEGVITTDIAGRVVLVNRVAEILTGWQQEQAQGRPLAEIFLPLHEQHRTVVDCPVTEVLATGNTASRDNFTLLCSRDGTERLVASTATPITDRRGEMLGVVLVFRDATEQREVQEELIKSRKLESLGVLAGGIAHDFNNFLTGIMGSISLSRMLTSPGEKAHDILTNAEQAAVRAKDLTQQLLTFSKGGAPVKRLAAIGKIVRESATFALHGSPVGCEFALADDLWPAEVDEGQMSQVVNNLIINACQAMPNGGTIRVSAANETVCASQGLQLDPGRYVRITVDDQGVGIPEECLSRIFDPYFTTKQQGSGLGLATVYSIIRNHGGTIKVSSPPGQGTSFIIYLPAVAAMPPRPKDDPKMISRGKGRILLVDDEEIIRFLLVDLLKSLGYEVVACADGADACELYWQAGQSGRPFAAVITDLTIPGGMGGKEAIQLLRQMDPHVCGIVSSGYSNDPIIADFEAYGFKAAISKPYSIADLALTLQNAIAPQQAEEA